MIITEIKCLVTILSSVLHIDEKRITEQEDIAEYIILVLFRESKRWKMLGRG